MTDLHELARLAGVATEWTGYGGTAVTVSDKTLRSILEALHALEPGEDAATAITRWEQTQADRTIAPTTVVRPGQRTVAVNPSSPLARGAGEDVAVALITENGQRVPLTLTDRSTIDLPDNLPLGYHHFEVMKDEVVVARAHLIAAPDASVMPDRGWGFMLQLYALRSKDSWGVGDIEDLRQLVRWSGGQGADFIVCNPLHADSPTLPQQPSPYFPSSRRFWNPSYLRIEQVPEYASAAPETLEQIAALARDRQADNGRDHIDRDAMWEAKLRALRLLWDGPHTPARTQALAAFREREGEPLRQFAVWCALALRHGPDWRNWPPRAQHPDTAVPDMEDMEDMEDMGDVHFFEWLQFLTDEQLAATQAAATHAGMKLGIIHDLAVGVNPAGADGWALQDHLATGVTVGAPPDDFNQQGQDWTQPPLLPDKLAETGYVVVRDLVRRLLRHAGGIRIDHILGYFRLFWIPPGGDAAKGTYVSYPSDDLLGVLALEATRAGAVIVGEDLGVVAPGVREAMRDGQMLGSRLLYFTYDEDGRRVPADAWDRMAMASITTHDLPTATGWWSNEGVRVQTELGLLGNHSSPEDERARKAKEHQSMQTLLGANGLLPGGTTDTQQRVIAMHAFLGRCASVLVAANLGDAVGDVRQPNMPGTIDEYPNWRLPIATHVDGASRPVSFEALTEHPQVQATIDALRVTRE